MPYEFLLWWQRKKRMYMKHNSMMNTTWNWEEVREVTESMTTSIFVFSWSSIHFEVFTSHTLASNI